MGPLRTLLPHSTSGAAKSRGRDVRGKFANDELICTLSLAGIIPAYFEPEIIHPT
jgi:hypothetical protein